MRTAIHVVIRKRLQDGHVQTTEVKYPSKNPLFENIDMRCGRQGIPNDRKFTEICREISIRLNDQAEAEGTEITQVFLHVSNAKGQWQWPMPQDVRMFYYDRRVERAKLDPPKVIRLDAGRIEAPRDSLKNSTSGIRVKVDALDGPPDGDEWPSLSSYTILEEGDRSYHLDGIDFQIEPASTKKIRQKNRAKMSKAARQLHRRLSADLEPRGLKIIFFNIALDENLVVYRDGCTVMHGKDL